MHGNRAAGDDVLELEYISPRFKDRHDRALDFHPISLLLGPLLKVHSSNEVAQIVDCRGTHLANYRPCRLRNGGKYANPPRIPALG